MNQRKATQIKNKSIRAFDSYEAAMVNLQSILREVYDVDIEKCDKLNDLLYEAHTIFRLTRIECDRFATNFPKDNPQQVLAETFIDIQSNMKMGAIHD